MIVAIDGPAGAGKTTVSRAVASRLGFVLIDTGALYRGVGLLAQRRGVAPTDAEALAQLADGAAFGFSMVDGAPRLSIDGEDVEDEIRTPTISKLASEISALPPVREALLSLQRRLGRASDSVVEGRDIGTVVFPDAACKVFLTASPRERATRRAQDYEERGRSVSIDEVEREIRERDERDSTRAVAPLKPAEDATIVDSTGLSFDQVVERIVGLAEAARTAH